mmetsp:Transcript_15205/g.29702  ORF Transcript_15205/g.29702 Transcript_15205/m.29702 type:complete len:287 (+) Transcript_15205:266-1126(+)
MSLPKVASVFQMLTQATQFVLHLEQPYLQAATQAILLVHPLDGRSCLGYFKMLGTKLQLLENLRQWTLWIRAYQTCNGVSPPHTDSITFSDNRTRPSVTTCTLSTLPSTRLLCGCISTPSIAPGSHAWLIPQHITTLPTSSPTQLLVGCSLDPRIVLPSLLISPTQFLTLAAGRRRRSSPSKARPCPPTCSTRLVLGPRSSATTRPPSATWMRASATCWRCSTRCSWQPRLQSSSPRTMGRTMRAGTASTFLAPGDGCADSNAPTTRAAYAPPPLCDGLALLHPVL